MAVVHYLLDAYLLLAYQLDALHLFVLQLAILLCVWVVVQFVVVSIVENQYAPLHVFHVCQQDAHQVIAYHVTLAV